jgi:hypothetical protein
MVAPTYSEGVVTRWGSRPLNAKRATLEADKKDQRQAPEHKVRISSTPDRRPWWRTWNDYPNPMRAALLGLLGIAVILLVFRFLLSM